MSDEPRDALARLHSLLEGRADGQYGLHDVTQRQHALQAALFAQRDGCAPALVTAALLHDIGHLVHDLGENPAAEGVDDFHERVGGDYLVQFFGPDVTDPVRLHVQAKRYLCAVEPDYFSRLSRDSILSLSLQGGPMSEAEADAFRAEPYFADAVRLRRYDEMAKVKTLATPDVAHFMREVAKCLESGAPAG